LLGEGIFVENELALFASLSFYNFIVCLLLGWYYPKSIWFAGLLANILVWSVLFTNMEEFTRVWHGWTALIISAYAGSFIGSVFFRKKQTSVNQKEQK